MTDQILGIVGDQHNAADLSKIAINKPAEHTMPNDHDKVTEAVWHTTDRSSDSSAQKVASDTQRRTTLHWAVGSAEEVKSMCEAGVDPNERDILGNSPLHYLVNGDGINGVIEYLIRFGAEINARNIRGKTPLHMACIRLRWQVIASLLHFGADPHAQDNYGATPLHYIALYQPLPHKVFGEVAALLSELVRGFHEPSGELSSNIARKEYGLLSAHHNAMLNETFVDGFSRHSVNNNDVLDYLRCWFLDVDYMYRAADDDDATTFTEMSSADVQYAAMQQLLSFRADPNARDIHGRTSLHIVSSLGYEELALCLVKAGAHFEISDNWKTTTLHEASFNGHKHIIDLLLLLNSSNKLAEEFINAKDTFPGETALHQSINSKRRAIVDALLDAGADVNARDLIGFTPLHLAVQAGFFEATQSLLAAGADVSLRNVMMNTPLHLLRMEEINEEYPCLDMADALIEAGANVNATNWFRRSALHMAAFNGLSGIVEYICDRGADPTIADFFGNTPLHIIKRSYVSARVLINRGAAVNATNEHGMTPLHLASIRLQAKMLGLLLKSDVDCNIQDCYGATPLHYLVRSQDRVSFNLYYQFVKVFIERGANCNIQTYYNQKTPLHLACENVQFLRDDLIFLCTDSNLTSGDNLRNTSLHSLHQHANFSAFKTSSAHMENCYGLTARLLSAKHGNFVEPLADFEHRDRLGRTVLHHLCASFSASAKDASPKYNDIICSQRSERDFLGRTSLHHLCIALCMADTSSKTYCDFVHLLSTEVNTRDIYGRTPLFYATVYQTCDFIKILLSMNADKTIADNDGILPIDVALALKFDSTKIAMLTTGVERTRQVLAFGWKEVSAPEWLTVAADFVDPTIPIKTYVHSKWKSLMQSRCDERFHESLKTSVVTFLNKLMRKVSEIDPRFHSEQILVGSSYENTRVSVPDEYDFLIVLQKFAPLRQENCSSSEYIRFKLATDSLDNSYADLVNLEHVLQPQLVKLKLYALIIEATSYPDVWQDGVFEYLKFKVENKPTSPALTVEMHLNRMWDSNRNVLYIQKFFKLSLDLVPAIPVYRPLIPNSKISDYLISNDLREHSIDCRAFAILKEIKHAAVPNKNGLCSSTFVILESELIHRCSPYAKAAYMTLKYLDHLKNRYRDSGIHKYALKTCMLHCIIDGSFDNVSTTDESEALMFCIQRILERLWKAVVDDSIPTIFNNQQFIPVLQHEPFAKFSQTFFQLFGLSYGVTALTVNSSPYLTPAEIHVINTRSNGFDSSAVIKSIERMRRIFNRVEDFCRRFLVDTRNDCFVKSEVATDQSQLLNDDCVLRYIAGEIDIGDENSICIKEARRVVATSSPYVVAGDEHNDTTFEMFKSLHLLAVPQ